MATGKFTVNEVEERTKVPASTLRQWERRYGFPKPERSDAGYRLYSELDLGYIDAMKRHIAEGIPASRAAQLVRMSTPGSTLTRPLQELQGELADALTRFDEERADQVIGEAHSLHPFDEVVERMLVEVEELLDKRALEGECERAALGAARSYLYGRLRGLLGQAPSLAAFPQVVVACAPDEPRELPPLAMTLLLRRAGYRGLYLGPDVAVEDLAVVAVRRRPAAVVVYASEPRSLLALQSEWWRLLEAAPVLALAGPAPVRTAQLEPALASAWLGPELRPGVSKLHTKLAAGQDAP